VTTLLVYLQEEAFPHYELFPHCLTYSMQVLHTLSLF